MLELRIFVLDPYPPHALTTHPLPYPATTSLPGFYYWLLFSKLLEWRGGKGRTEDIYVYLA